MQSERLSKWHMQNNAQMGHRQLRETCRLDAEGSELLREVLKSSIYPREVMTVSLKYPVRLPIWQVRRRLSPSMWRKRSVTEICFPGGHDGYIRGGAPRLSKAGSQTYAGSHRGVRNGGRCMEGFRWGDCGIPFAEREDGSVFLAYRKETEPEEIGEKLYRLQIRCVTWEDDLYPPLLQTTANPPAVLFYKGNDPVLRRRWRL